MQLTAADIEAIPARNVRVPVADFAALWVAAEAFHDRCVATRTPDWYGAGVVATCRWLARATVRPAEGPWRPSRAPMTSKTALAYEELIQAEALTAETCEGQSPRPRWLVDEPGFIEAVVATFRWAWWRTGPAPFVLEDSATA